MQSPEDFNPLLGRPGAEKRSHFLEMQRELEKREQNIYVMDPKAGELPDTSATSYEV